MKKRTLIVFLVMAVISALCFTACGKEEMTLEKYVKDNPDIQESIDSAMNDSNVVVEITGNDISYTFDLSKKVKWLRDITLTAVGDNLFLWKKYNGFDPDVSSEGTSSTLRRADIGAYPKARTFTFSIQLRY